MYMLLVYYPSLHTYIVITVQNNWTPLHAAARQGHARVVGVLIELGANINVGDVVSYHKIMLNYLHMYVWVYTYSVEGKLRNTYITFKVTK